MKLFLPQHTYSFDFFNVVIERFNITLEYIKKTFWKNLAFFYVKEMQAQLLAIVSNGQLVFP